MRTIDLVKLVRQKISEEIYPATKGDPLDLLLCSVELMILKRDKFFDLINPGAFPGDDDEELKALWLIKKVIHNAAIELMGE